MKQRNLKEANKIEAVAGDTAPPPDTGDSLDNDGGSATVAGGVTTGTGGATLAKTQKVAPEKRREKIDVEPYLKLMVEKSASDIFFTTTSPVKIKIEGEFHSVGSRPLSADRC